jgi:crotonobetainyl-CoA:carnitine CoA-transferase CaiB-like acyl-CoA transferase
MQSAAGIVAALLVRDQCGLGQRIDATMFSGIEPLEYLVSVVSQLLVKRGEKPAIDVRSGVPGSRYGVLVATSDGRFIQTSGMQPHQARALSEVAGIQHTFDDPRFAAQPVFASAEDAQAWEDLLWEAFRSHDLAYWLPRLEASPDVAFEVARTSEEGLHHPQIIHNGDVVTVADPTHGPVRQVGPIAHFSGSPCRIEKPAPALGVHQGGFAERTPMPVPPVVLAIFHQRRTGRGQFVRTSMISGNAWCYADDFCTYAGKPATPVCDDDYFGLSALERVYPAAQGWVCLVVRTEREWRALTDAIGLPELAADPRFATAAARQSNDDELIGILGARFAAQTSAAWEELLNEADVGCVDVGFAGHPGFIAFDEGLREAGFTTEIEHPRFGPMVIWAPHLRFSKTPSRLGRPCERGEHNRPVLADAGYSGAEIDRLEATGAVVPPGAVPENS